MRYTPKRDLDKRRYRRQPAIERILAQQWGGETNESRARRFLSPYSELLRDSGNNRIDLKLFFNLLDGRRQVAVLIQGSDGGKILQVLPYDRIGRICRAQIFGIFFRRKSAEEFLS